MALRRSEQQANQPFPASKLVGSQRYYYERLSQKLYQIFDSVKDPNDLDGISRDKYRNLIKIVGKAALAMEHNTKACDILSHLRLFRDREFDDNELLLLGNAHLWASDEAADESEREDHWKKAIPLLKSAMDKNPYEVRTQYNLGWALLSLGQYEDGIKLMENCIKLYQPITPWAKWNIACGETKQGKKQDAMETLKAIPPGPWWTHIAQDDWFEGILEEPDLRDAFRSLCEAKTRLANEKA